MKTVPVDENDPRIQAAIKELKEMIKRHWPSAVFSVYRGFDPEGIYLTVMVDVEDRGVVMEAIIERMVDMQVEEGLPVFVHVEPPPKSHAHQV